MAGPFKIVGPFFVNQWWFSADSHKNIIDISDSLGDHDVNCCYTDVSFSVRLSILRCVSYFHSPLLFGFAAHVLVRCPSSLEKSLPTSGRIALKTDRTPTAPIYLTGMHVAVHNAHEQPSTPQASRFGTDIAWKPHEKPHELTVDLVADRDMEKTGSENGVV